MHSGELMKYTKDYWEYLNKDYEQYVIRAVNGLDRDGYIEAFNMSSRKTLTNRFLAAKKGLTDDDLKMLTEPDYVDHVAIVIIKEQEEGFLPIASTRFFRDYSGSDKAEFSVAVVDQEQGKGFGGIILDHLIEAAKERGIKELYGTASVNNGAILNLLKSRGEVVVEHETTGVVNMRLKI